MYTDNYQQCTYINLTLWGTRLWPNNPSAWHLNYYLGAACLFYHNFAHLFNGLFAAFEISWPCCVHLGSFSLWFLMSYLLQLLLAFLDLVIFNNEFCFMQFRTSFFGIKFCILEAPVNILAILSFKRMFSHFALCLRYVPRYQNSRGTEANWSLTIFTLLRPSWQLHYWYFDQYCNSLSHCFQWHFLLVFQVIGRFFEIDTKSLSAKQT